MEGEHNKDNLYAVVQPSDIQNVDHEQFDDVLSTDSLDNDTYKNTPASHDNISHTDSVRQWKLFGKTIPKNEVIFICQVVILYIVIITCIINLSLGNGDSNLWTALLSSSMGIMLPAPTLSRRRH